MAAARPRATLPPLLNEQKGVTVLVPPSATLPVAVSSAADVVHDVLRETQSRTKCPRSTGSVKPGALRKARLAQQQNILPRANRHNPAAPLPIVTEQDLDKGLLSCINRGLIPQSFDVTGAMGGEAGHPPLSAEPVDLRPHVEQFARRELLTADYGLAPICNLKLDIQAILHPQPPQVPRDNSDVRRSDDVSTGGQEDKNGALETEDEDDHLGAKKRDDPRTYTDLLDMYSLHEFVIRKGRTLDSTPEFQSFHRSYSGVWGAVLGLIRQLEKLLTEYGVPLAYVDGKKLATLAQLDMGEANNTDLVDCIANKDEVLGLLSVPGRRYQEGDAGIRNAAVKVQSIIRMFLQKRRFRDLRESHFAALLIQRHWQIHQQHMFTRRHIKQGQQGEETAWRKLMDNFIRNWGTTRNSKRLVIHVPSLSYTPEQCATQPFFNSFQNSQLMRIFDLVDPNVEVAYLSPFPIEVEALQYYTRLLQLSGVPDIGSRLHVLTPENQDRLPKGLSLTKCVLYSQRNLKRLSSLAKGKRAYVVPGVVGKEDLALACRLQLPMLGPDPAISSHFASKSGAKRIFELADVVTPIGAYDMYEEEELLVILSKFIAEYPEHQKWLVKIDNEFNGRGIACIDIRRLRSLEEQRGHTDLATLREKVYLELKDYIGKRVKIITPSVYPEWGAFMRAFNRYGGVVEAVPADCVSSPIANLYIHPDGAVQLLSVQEQVLSPQYCSLGAAFPQTAVPHAAVRDASLSIASVCYQKKIMGYISVEYVVFKKEGQLRMWAVDLELHLTNTSLAHRLFQFTTCSRADPETGLCHAEDGTPLHYVYSGLIYHPYIGALRHSVFFSRCKVKGLAFDTVDRTGTVFHLVDSILRGCIGVLCIARTEDETIRMLSEAMEFIQQQLTNSSAEDSDTNFVCAAAAARALFQKVISQRRGHGPKRSARRGLPTAQSD